MDKKSTSSGGGKKPSSQKAGSSDHDNTNIDSSSYVDDIISMQGNTFRDTEIRENQANNLMKMQSIASIINDPKRDSFYKQVKSFVSTVSDLGYKPHSEKYFNESSSLPNIIDSDFKHYLTSIEDVQISITYSSFNSL